MASASVISIEPEIQTNREGSEVAMKRWRCIICGYIHDGDEPPLMCPVCGAPRELFEEITISEEQT
jgi:rubrerythrin